jgi:hypothetical protein
MDDKRFQCVLINYKLEGHSYGKTKDKKKGFQLKTELVIGPLRHKKKKKNKRKD